jgi:hypothetical protein
LARRQPLRPGLNEQAEYIEARFLCECRESGNGIWFFHVSIIVEIMVRSNAR